MAANGSGLKWSTIRNMALAWVMTLPAAMAIAGGLYVIFRQIFRTRRTAMASILAVRMSYSPSGDRTWLLRYVRGCQPRTARA